MSPEKAERLTANDVAKRLVPSHLEEVSTEDMKAAVEKEVAPVEAAAPVDPANDPRAKNPYGFQFDWTDSRGKRWQGHFVTHYPTPRDLLQAGVMQTRLTGSVPKESLDALTDEIAFIVSRLSFCLDERPEWFTDPLSLIDGVPLLQAIFTEVMAFESFFREHGTVTSPSKKKPGNK
jgi:hypothetical protein